LIMFSHAQSSSSISYSTSPSSSSADLSINLHLKNWTFLWLMSPAMFYSNFLVSACLNNGEESISGVEQSHKLKVRQSNSCEFPNLNLHECRTHCLHDAHYLRPCKYWRHRLKSHPLHENCVHFSTPSITVPP
jgi:hypothetical protein